MAPSYLSTSLYDLMQAAVDIVQRSPHPTNKIAATLSIGDYAISRTNEWPAAVADSFTFDTKIGNASGTIHAETACILGAEQACAGASIFVTDPPCPNCMKNIAEAGIKALYIDHKGFHKDFARRRGHHFENMSMQICEAAGIGVYELWRKEELLETILLPPEEKQEEPEDPTLRIAPLREETDKQSAFRMGIKQELKTNQAPFALALAFDKEGSYTLLCANEHLTIEGNETENDSNKYSPIIQPVNRIMMAAAKLGCKIDPDYFYSSRIPTARELVNMVGANLNTLHIGDTSSARDDYALEAMKQLCDVGIMNVQSLF